MNTAFISSDRYRFLSYSGEHPLIISSFALTEELIRAYGMLDGKEMDSFESPLCREEDILRFHSIEYLEVLKRANKGKYFKEALDYGFDFRDCPIFPRVCEWALSYSGGTMEAVRLVESGRYSAAFNLAGGLHHAGRAKASGFCFLNDPAMAIAYLVEKGYRVAYLDMEAHHCDGVQDAFYCTPQVLTISLHEDGRCLFPGTGFPHEIGEGEGRGYNLNIPYFPYATEEIFFQGFKELALPLIVRFNPDIFITQAGVDTLRGDPMANLLLTNGTYVEMLKEQKLLGLPWIVLGGGGYSRENVVRGWCLAAAVVAGIELPHELPESFKKRFPDEKVSQMVLRDPPFREELSQEKERRRKQILRRISLAQEEWERTREILKSEVLPQMLPLHPCPKESP